MQQATEKTLGQTVRRSLLISLGIILAATLMTALYIGWNYQRLTIKLANNFLQPYQMHIEHLRFTPLTFTHFQVPKVSLTVNGSDIEITDLDIILEPDSKLWAIGVNDLRSLSAKQLQVQLAPNILRHSSTPSHDTSSTIALDFSDLPEIQIGQTLFSVKGVSATKLNMALDYLVLDSKGHFSSAISHNQQPVFALDAQLSATQWRATTRLDLTQLQQLTSAIRAAETALFTVNPTTTPLSTSRIIDTNVALSSPQDSSLLAPLYALQAAINAQKIDFSATLDSTMTLAIKSAQLQSTHRLNQLQIGLNAFAGLQLTPSLIVNGGDDATTDNKTTPPIQSTGPLTPTGQLAFNIDGHITDLKLTLLPFELPIALNAQQTATANKSSAPQQLISLLNKLDDVPLEQALAHLYQVLTTHGNADQPQMGPIIRITVAAPLVYRLNKRSLLLPKLRLAVENTKLAAVVHLQDIHYDLSLPIQSSQTLQNDDYRLTFDWQLQASHQQNIIINTLWPTLVKLPYEVAIDSASLALQGSFTAENNQDKSTFEVTVLPQATQLTQGITISPNKEHLNNQNGSIITASMTQTQLVLGSKASYRFGNGQTNISIPALQYQIQSAELNQQSTDEQQTHYQLLVDVIDIALAAPISLQLTAKNSTPPINQLLQHELTNQVGFSIDNLVLDKSALALKSNKVAKIKKSHQLVEQRLLHLDQVELSQQLDLNANKLTTEEIWQINGLNLFSLHQYQPEYSNPSQYQLAGQWQFNSEFEPIIAFLSQSNSLPESLDLNGNASINMHYRLNRNKYTRFSLTLKPHVADIQGSFADLPFEGGNIDTQCQYQWQQLQSQSRTSNFNCDDINLSLQAFNPGVLLTDIEAEAAVSFSTDSSQVLTESSSNGQHNLALPAELFGVQQASFNLTAKGDLLGGQLLIPQFQLNLKQPSSAYFVMQQIDLEQLLEIQPQVGIYADGIFDAVLPVTLENGQAAISGGQIAARAPGGLIAVSGNPAVDQMRLSQPYLEFAFSALEHLEYSELSSSFDMDFLGNALLKVNVKGKSRGIERPIHLNYSQEENMLQLLKSLQIGNNLQNQIENSIQQ
ncbi:YdbH domain-containing protein [Shewanella sp. KX20019]|uniref:YdbH domain-containing protein n=1 Tax=Shewanella sp. KX20019 TaxID=2803864 RepID=UPI001928D928|nr:YdbH domain-containing protein [Shewanella sp. KX20019]QQX78475.1 YdbH domain-containing protein [Shewanella sp. KX20019]